MNDANDVVSSQHRPAKVGRYEIEGELGRGMMGIVYRALDPHLGRRVALKMIHLAQAVGEDQRTVFEKRFLIEARAAAGLAHPAIVVVHDIGRDPELGALFIAFELLDGQTLATLIRSGPPFEWPAALRLVERLADGLHHAHQRGVIHRDIKPANIMVLSSGEPKLMDFGIVHQSATHLTASGEFLGTPGYMSPEQLSEAPVDGRSDLFALGAVLYLLLTRRDAFEGESVAETLGQILHRDPPPPSQLVPGVPAAVDSIVAHALAKDPADRYADGRAFCEDCADVLAGRSPRHAEGAPVRSRSLEAAAPAATPTRAKAGWSARLGRPGLWVLALVVVATGLIFSALLLRFVGQGGVLPISLTLPAVKPAQLEIFVEHTLRSGVLRVWVDERLLLEEPLESRVAQDLLVVKVRRGTELKTLDVAPGEHAVRIQIAGEGFSASRTIRGTFESEVTRRLEVQVAGMIFKKELSVVWGASRPGP